MPLTKKLVFSYEEDEYLPLLISIGHNLKKKNICDGNIQIILNNNFYEIINIKTLHNNKSIEMNLTFSIKNNNYYFTRGFLYVDEKEIFIHDFKSYLSLQIEDICHDNISVIRIPENLWS
jgi:hypothetical protein